jgi:hypothetical protein
MFRSSQTTDAISPARTGCGFRHCTLSFGQVAGIMARRPPRANASAMVVRKVEYGKPRGLAHIATGASKGFFL